MLFGNTLTHYLQFLVAFALAMGISLFLKYVVIKKLLSLAKQTKYDLDDVLFSFLSSLKLHFYIIVTFYLSVHFLTLNDFARRIVDAIFVISVVYHVIDLIRVVTEYVLDKRANGENGSSVAHVKDILRVLVNFGFWTMGLLFILSNLGINITSLIAGLGIGGIAVALAVQNILGDLFSYFAIYFDRPFIKGDVVLVGEHMGVIEKIGIKTTRIRALQGEEIVISNSELTSSRIQNFKRMDERRIVFSVGVVYETPLPKLEKIPSLLRDIITSIELARFDRAHLSAFGDSAYLYEVVYYVQSADYTQYMDVHQTIHLRVIEAFTREDIEFAYPTSTVHLTRRS